LPPDVPIVAGVGNLVPEKGFDLLVRAAAHVPGLHVLLVGEGRSASSLEALADRLMPGRLHRRTSMPQAELPFVYSAADALALPSFREGWPNVLLESMACGTPVVAAHVGGVPEIVVQDAAGIVVAGREASEWSRAIADAIASRPQALHVRACAAQFGWEAVLDCQCNLYESIRSGGGGGASVSTTGNSAHVRLLPSRESP
jgi:glycosyltransferase involved in cell wall biosynthesis